MRVPDRFETEPRLCWRNWRLRIATGDLVSMSGGYPWPRGEPMVAGCDLEPIIGASGASHIADGSDVEYPSIICTCGIWVYNDPEVAIEKAASFGDWVMNPVDLYSIVVAGQVSIWGKLVDHERGFRAQYAYPYSVRVPSWVDDSDELAAFVRDEYQVDVEIVP